MKPDSQTAGRQEFNRRLSTSGLRLTAQRQEVYDVLVAQLGHPTADDVFLLARQEMPDISLATVYNSLDALVHCGLVRQVHVDRSATRYCLNMQDHHHFFCERCGGVFDVEPIRDGMAGKNSLPRGFTTRQVEVSLRGICAGCNTAGNS